MNDTERLEKIRSIVRKWPRDDRYFDLAFLLGINPLCPDKFPEEWR